MHTPERPLHLAFLGCGRIAVKHRRTLASVSPNVLCSFASRDAERARDFKRRYRGAASWGSYGAAIADPAVDLVMITTPTSSHLELALAALAAGKDVIVEKPAFLHSEDVTTVERAAAAVGRCVFVAENYCYKPLATALRQLVASGELGDIRFVSVNALTRQNPGGWRDDHATAGGGALFEGGIHWIDLVAHLGLTVESVEGFRPRAGDAIERSVLVVLRYAEGGVGTLHHSWETPGRLRGLQLSRIAGTRGSATFESNGLFIHVHTGKRSRWIFPGFADISGYRAMFADFLGAIDRGRDGGMTLARARRDLELVEQALTTSADRTDHPHHPISEAHSW